MARASTYTTIAGDTWDLIAYKVYGAEKYAQYLMEHNYPQLDVLIFGAGTVLKTPALPETAATDGLPIWRS